MNRIRELELVLEHFCQMSGTATEIGNDNVGRNSSPLDRHHITIIATITAIIIRICIFVVAVTSLRANVVECGVESSSLGVLERVDDDVDGIDGPELKLAAVSLVIFSEGRVVAQKLAREVAWRRIELLVHQPKRGAREAGLEVVEKCVAVAGGAAADATGTGEERIAAAFAVSLSCVSFHRGEVPRVF